ncbi:MAG: hypothetical protein ACKV2T_26460 [Kofleriaceae bacterium]
MKRFLVGAAMLIGCYKDVAAPAQPPAQSTLVTQRAPARDYRVALGDPVGFLPANTEAVIAIDGDQLRRSALWNMVESKLRATAGPDYVVFTTACGFDPFLSIRRITIGLRDLKKPSQDGIVVITGVSKTKLTECIDRVAATDTKAVVVERGIYTVHKDAADTVSLVFTFVDEATLVLHAAPSANRASLEKILAAGVPLRRSPTFTQLLAQVDTSASAWGIVNGRASIFDLSQGNQKPTAVWGSVHLASGAQVSMRMRFADAATAQHLATQAQTQLQGAAQMFFDRLDVNADGEELVVDAAMSDTKLASLMSLMGMAMNAQTAAPPSTAPTLGPSP